MVTGRLRRFRVASIVPAVQRGSGCSGFAGARRSGAYRGQLSKNVTGIAIGLDGSAYLADPGLGRVLRVHSAGRLVIVADYRTFARSTPGSPNGIVLTSEGDLLVSDAWQHVIWKITIDEDE